MRSNRSWFIMPSELELAQNFADRPRYRVGQNNGAYESYFQRANHPVRPLAFWLRYTVFSPDARPDQAMGEVWGVYFDGEIGEITAAKTQVPIKECSFGEEGLRVDIGAAWLKSGSLRGSARSQSGAIGWNLVFGGGQDPLFDLPRKLYDRRLPRAKAVVASPLCTYDGTLVVNGSTKTIGGWIGSQNHNWGTRHTDHYAWGQVAGFEEAPDSFLELATARMRFGPLWTPFMTLLVLRHEDEEYRLNSLVTSLRTRASFNYFTWRFIAHQGSLGIAGTIQARPQDFVALTYRNPPGGNKCCLNSKIASCIVELRDKKSGRRQILFSENRAAFEILGDDFESHGIPVVL